MDGVKVAYLHFAGKLPRKYKDKAIMSVAICTDYYGYNMVMKQVEVVDAETSNNKWVDIQALDYALNYLFKIQSELISLGVSRIFLVTDNPNLFGYLTDKPLSKAVKEWLDIIYTNYSVFGPKELKLGIGVCKLCERNRAKTYYFEKFVENPEYFNLNTNINNSTKTAKRKTYVFEDINNMVTAKDLLNESAVEGVDELAALE